MSPKRTTSAFLPLLAILTTLSIFLIQPFGNDLKVAGSAAGLAPTGLVCQWDGSIGGWNDPAHWSCGAVPDAGDTAVVSSGNPTLSADAAVGTLQFDGGAITCNAGLSVNNSFIWTAGNIKGGASYGITSNGAFSLGGGTKELSQTTLINNGDAVWTGGVLIQNNGATFRNQSGATFDIKTDAVWAGDAVGSFTNAGTTTKSVGSSLGQQITTSIVNTGTLNINAGVPAVYNSSTNSGSISVAAGADLQLALGPHTFNTGSSLSGAGVLTLLSGDINFNAALNLTGTLRMMASSPAVNFNAATNIPNLDIQGGVLGGTGNLTILNSLTYSASTEMRGTGSLTIAPTASFDIGGTSLSLKKAILNQGVMNWNNGFIDMFDGGAINNQPGGIFNLVVNQYASNYGIVRGNAPGNAINNAGRIVRKNAQGATPTSIRLPFNNAGTLEITDASLDLRTDYQGFTPGTVNQTAGTTILSGGTLIGGLAIDGGTLTGVGSITGSVTNNGKVAPGLTDDAPGTITINGNYTQTSGGRLDIELGGTNPGVDSDLLSTSTSISTSAVLTGTLDVSLLPGFHPAAAATFQIMRYGAKSGQFATINGLDLGGGQVMAPEYRASEMVLVAGNGGPAVPWIEAVANPPEIRGTPGATFDFDYTVRIGNSGGEMTPVIVFIELPKGPVIDPETDERAPVNDEIEEEISNAPLVPIEEDDDRALFNTMPKKFKRDDGTEVIPFVMSLQPGSSYSLKGGFSAICPSGMGGSSDPMPKVKMVGNSLWPSKQCISSVAQLLVGFIPGTDCLNILRDFFVTESFAFATEGEAASLSSVFASLALNGAKCAASVFPVSNAIKNAIKVVELISMGNDFHGIYDECKGSFTPNPSDSELGAESGTRCVSAKDPNDKVGPQGAGTARFLTGDEPLRYTVFFENVPDASAPAQVVVIRDQLNPALVNLNTFALGPISVADRQLIPPQNSSSFIGDIDLRPDKNLLVHVIAGLDKDTGLLTVLLASIDPLTGQPLPPTSTQGFLNPNITRPEGEGSIAFNVQPKSGLPTGTVVVNKAQIVFDDNDAIDTPEWFNTIDNTKPASSVLPLALGQCSSFRVDWAGSDTHSGVATYSVFVSRNGAAFEPWLQHTGKTSAFYNGVAGSTYAFYSIARDAAGNVEAAPPQPDAITAVTTAMAISPVDQSFTAFGGMGTVNVSAAGGCNWIAVSRDFYVHVLTGASGAGNGTVTFAVDPNPTDEARDGSLVIAGSEFVITQAKGPAMVNRPPKAMDDAAETNQNTAVDIAVLDNDSDPDGDAMVVSGVTQAAHGSVALVGNTVRYTPQSGFNGDDSFTYSISDGRDGTNSAAVAVRVIRSTDTDPPVVTSETTTSSLWPPNHELINVGLSLGAVDAQDGPLVAQVSVFANEDDEEPTGDELHSPDAKNIAAGTLRLRSERKETGSGRVYVIVVKAVDSAGNAGISCKSVTVPFSRSAASIASINARAATARAYCQANGGAPPPGFFRIGDGPVLGSKQ